MQILQPTSNELAETPSRTDAGFLSALIGGGDSRLVIDPVSGTNKYLVGPGIRKDQICFSSCTASPIGYEGYELARTCYRDVAFEDDRTPDVGRLFDYEREAKAKLLKLVGAEASADIVLLPSGTDALLYTSIMLASEARGTELTAILPSASETGTGVPLAAACRDFDSKFRTVLHEGWTAPIEVPLRGLDGLPRSDDEISEAFAAAARAAPGRPVIYLTHGSKTGLVAPLHVPSGIDVVVDACQLRLSSAAIQAYLLRGWPVIITGSKFLGGPAFSGAVLLPRGRFRSSRCVADSTWSFARKRNAPGTSSVFFGTVLRWTAALASPRQAIPLQEISSRMGSLTEIAAQMGEMSEVIQIIPGPSEAMIAAGGFTPGIVTFAVRDPRDAGRNLSAEEMRSLYRTCADGGFLLGQPVDLGGFGGLRIAIGLGDISWPAVTRMKLEKLHAFLHEELAWWIPTQRSQPRLRPVQQKAQAVTREAPL